MSSQHTAVAPPPPPPSVAVAMAVTHFTCSSPFTSRQCCSTRQEKETTYLQNAQKHSQPVADTKLLCAGGCERAQIRRFAASSFSHGRRQCGFYDTHIYMTLLSAHETRPSPLHCERRMLLLVLFFPFAYNSRSFGRSSRIGAFLKNIEKAYYFLVHVRRSCVNSRNTHIITTRTISSTSSPLPLLRTSASVLHSLMDVSLTNLYV